MWRDLDKIFGVKEESATAYGILGENFTDRPRHLPWPKFFVTRMLIRDLFAVANLLFIISFTVKFINEQQNKAELIIPPLLKSVAALPCEKFSYTALQQVNSIKLMQRRLITVTVHEGR